MDEQIEEELHRWLGLALSKDLGPWLGQLQIDISKGTKDEVMRRINSSDWLVSSALEVEFFLWNIIVKERSTGAFSIVISSGLGKESAHQRNTTENSVDVAEEDHDQEKWTAMNSLSFPAYSTTDRGVFASWKSSQYKCPFCLNNSRAAIDRSCLV